MTASTLVLHAAGLDGGCAQFLDLPGILAPTLVPDVLAPGQRLSLVTIAEQVAAGLTEPVDVVGLSMGGMVAQHLALRFPHLVRSLVLACTTTNPDSEVMRARAQFTRTAPRQDVIDDTIQRWFSDRGATGNDEGVTYARARLSSIPLETFAEVWLAIADHDLDGEVRGIRQPTTCLAGSVDVSTPLDEMSRMCDQLPTGRLAVIDGPHMAFLESPGPFSEEVRQHLAWARTRKP